MDGASRAGRQVRHVDVKLPLIVPLTWFALVLGLWGSAYAASERRERRVLGLVLAGSLLGPVVFYGLLIRPTGFGLQGRHVLPFLAIVPLLAGEALNRRRGRLLASWLRLLAGIVPPVVAMIQAGAWYANARRYAVGSSHRATLLGHAAWAPPAGWLPWLAAVLLGGLCLGALALRLPTDRIGRRLPRRRSSRPSATGSIHATMAVSAKPSAQQGTPTPKTLSGEPVRELYTPEDLPAGIGGPQADRPPRRLPVHARHL